MEVEGLQHSSLCSDESCLRTFPIYSQRAFPYIVYSWGQVLYWFCCLDKSWTTCQNFLKGKDSSHIFFDIYKTCKIQKVLNYNLLQKSQWEDKQIEKKNTEKVEKCVCLCLYVRFHFSEELFSWSIRTKQKPICKSLGMQVKNSALATKTEWIINVL